MFFLTFCFKEKERKILTYSNEKNNNNNNHVGLYLDLKWPWDRS